MLDLKTPNIIREPYPMQARSCSLFRALNHRCDLCSWHIAAFAAPQHFGGYWGHSGHRNGIAANYFLARLLKFWAWKIHCELQGTTKRMKIGEADEMDFNLLASR
jgi:hypothetical protein